jgi:hypothetical protein
MRLAGERAGQSSRKISSCYCSQHKTNGNDQYAIEMKAPAEQHQQNILARAIMDWILVIILIFPHFSTPHGSK